MPVGLRSKIAVTLQMRSGESQSPQTPVRAHGVCLPSRLQFGGQAYFLMRAIAASLPEGRRAEALRQAALGLYLKCTCRTVVNLKRGRQAFRAGDRAEVERIARLEYANAREALAAVDADSRLGWLCSSGYTGSRPQIEWKLRRMEELYGGKVK